MMDTQLMTYVNLAKKNYKYIKNVYRKAHKNIKILYINCKNSCNRSVILGIGSKFWRNFNKFWKNFS